MPAYSREPPGCPNAEWDELRVEMSWMPPHTVNPSSVTSLRFLTLGVLLFSFMAFAVAQWASTRWLYGGGFDREERTDAMTRAKHARDLALERASFLENYASDNGAWDDAVNFMHGADTTLPERVFVPESYRRTNSNAYAFIDPKFKPFRAAQYDPKLQGFMAPDPEFIRAISARGVIGRRLDASAAVRGFAWIGNGIYAWGAAPVTRSDNSGPVAGYLVLVSQLDQRFIDGAANSVDAAVALAVAGGAANMDRSVFATHADGTLEVQMPVALLDGRESLQIRVSRGRLVHAIAVRASHYLLVSTLLFGALVTVLALWFVERRLLRPVILASQRLTRIGRTGDLSTRLDTPPHSDEIGQLIVATNDMLAKLESKRDAESARDAALRASQLKSEFLARMSHEIRTPMNAVMGMTELLQNTSLTPRQRRLAETAHKSAELLLGVINDILDFSKLESGYFGLVVEEFDIRGMVEETVELIAERAHAKHLELILRIDADVPRTVNGDSMRLRQVLTNLIANAIKFTDAGEVAVRVSIALVEQGREQLELAVTDTGIGIPAEAQQGIFEPFTQADGSTTRRFQGTGLGLAIARQLVELMGGTLAVRSAPAAGATFTVRLDAPARPNGPRCAASPVDLTGVRVLIVDDNATNLGALVAELAATGAEVVGETLASEALKRMPEQSPRAFDVLVTDSRMPEMSGEILVRRIRRRTHLNDLRIIMLTPIGSAEDTSILANSSVQAILTKPMLGDELPDTVLKVLRESRTGTELLPAPTPAARLPRALALHVLLVEDNAVNREVAIGMLEHLGCLVVQSHNGRDALGRFEPGAFDVVLMDCQMPEMDGFAATREMRRRELRGAGSPVPIIALTANASPSDREQCLAAGMTGFLSKPFTLEKLEQALAPRSSETSWRGCAQGRSRRTWKRVFAFGNIISSPIAPAVGRETQGPT